MRAVRLYFKETAIRDDGEFLCLTDMWRAAGSDQSKRPAHWLRLPATTQFSEYLSDMSKSHTLVRRVSGNPAVGEGGATWAHWQLGMAYAKYLSPEFHAWCNDVVRAVMQGAPVPSANGGVLAALAARLDSQERQMQALVQAFTAMAERGASATISQGEFLAIRRRISFAANAAVRSGRYKSRRQALGAYRMRVCTAAGWYGTGSKLEKMPAGAYPYAEKELATIERELEHGGEVRQLSLLRGSVV